MRSRRKAEGAETRGLKRQTGGADGRSNAVGSRRKAPAAEMRELKRQTEGADGRSNAVGSRRNAPAAERRSAGLSGRQPTAVSRRQLAAPAPLLFIIYLARALFPTAGAFSLCSLPRLLRWSNSSPARPSRPRVHSPTHPRNFYSLRTIFPAVIPRSCSFCAQLRHAAPPRGRLLVYKGSKRVNERSTRSNHLTRLLVYESTCLQGK